MATTDQTNNQPSNQSSNLQLSQLPEINILIESIKTSKIPAEFQQRLLAMLDRLLIAAKIGGYSTEFESIRKYVDWAKSIPWGVYTQDNLDIKQAAQMLDKYHYGLQPVKDNIVEYLSVMKLQHESGGAQSASMTEEEKAKKLRGSSYNAPILCFVGVQGVGKTSMAKSIANALGRKFMRISLGAMGKAYELRGRGKGEPDAEPGQIVKALVKTGVMNPLILLDEIDKVSGQEGLRADVMAALLEILDPEQNATFRDHYMDYPVDLSQTIFITTANNLGGISTALLDRLEIVRFTSYSPEEKKYIAKNYLLPKVREATGLTEQHLAFADDVWDLIINPLGFEAGVRQLERTLTRIARKAAKQIVDGQATQVTVTRDNFRQYIPMDFDVYT